MYENRIEDYKKLEEVLKAKLLVFVTGDKPNLGLQISREVIPLFVDHMDSFNYPDKIVLYIYTRGGETLAAWSIVNLIKSFCRELEVIIPSNCHSAGTLICLGASKITMTKQATLGPIDPSTNGLMNPQININGQNVRVPVSVEAVNGYLEIAKSDLGIKNENNIKDILLCLSEKIHPLSIGEVYRSKSQIQMLAKKLLKNHKLSKDKIEEDVIKFLCSDSGSHDYTINRNEACDELGLNIDVPDEPMYEIIKNIYKDIESELDLRNPFNPVILLGDNNSHDYNYKRGLIESITGGCDAFVSEGRLIKQQISTPPGQSTMITDSRKTEGWIHQSKK